MLYSFVSLCIACIETIHYKNKKAALIKKRRLANFIILSLQILRQLRIKRGSLRTEPVDQLAVFVDQEFFKVPFDLAGEIRVWRLC